MAANEFDFVIVGAGFYGAVSALHLQSKGYRVALLEQEDTILARASYWNQARIHGGYHYPRSLTTALRSQSSYQRFSEDFANCINADFDSYYAIAKERSLITGDQFYAFCKRINAPIAQAERGIASRFDADLIEAVFKVTEHTFNAEQLRAILLARLTTAGITLKTNCTLLRAVMQSNNFILQTSQQVELRAESVLICGYAATNQILKKMNLPAVPLKFQLAELALIKPLNTFPAALTVMDGPFFSYMPFPALDLFSFSHVSYTPHKSWDHSVEFDWPRSSILELATDSPAAQRSNWLKMYKDTLRYWPEFEAAQYQGNFQELKALLPRSQNNDSRPIFVASDYAAQKNLHIIMGSKIDNVYDCLEYLDQYLLKQQSQPHVAMN